MGFKYIGQFVSIISISITLEKHCSLLKLQMCF